jgi:short-chain fatty acids transporter
MIGPMLDASAPPDRLTRFALAVGRVIPDATTMSIVMLLIVALAAFALGNSASVTLDAYYRGLWMLLPFTMQMTLILLLSSSLGASPVFKRLVARLARLPRSTAQVFVFATLTAAALSYVYWGLGITLGPLVAIYFAREAEERGMKVDFPFLLAVVAAANSVWQFGLSASAPLLVNTPGHFLEKTTGLMPLGTTIWAPASLAMIGLFLLALMAAARLLHPKTPALVSTFPDAYQLAEPLVPPGAEPTTPVAAPLESYSNRLERNQLPTLVLSLALGFWLYSHFAVKGLGLDLNALNTIMLLSCLLVHRNVRNFSESLKLAIAACWPIVVLYHLYAGVAGLIQFTSVGEAFAGAFAAVSNRLTFPFFTALASAVVSMFVPSSGGQWVIQGFVTATAAEAVGVSVQRGLLALSVGDQVGNLVTPFWAAIMSGVARVDFRRFIGYSIGFSVIWFVLGVLVFTFLPA